MAVAPAHDIILPLSIKYPSQRLGKTVTVVSEG
jgi:hypothetical protein